MQTLVLASGSRWRRQLLEDVGVIVEVDPADIDERAVHHADPAVLAGMLAQAKAARVAMRHPGRWVLGADQVVHADGEIFGKPDDPDDHLRRLVSMRGRSHALVTGWCLRGPGPDHDAVARTVMHVRADLTDAELAAYVATGEGSGCAGGYAVEGQGARLFRAIDGDWFNVIGLPVLDVLDALRARGWSWEAPA